MRWRPRLPQRLCWYCPSMRLNEPCSPLSRDAQDCFRERTLWWALVNGAIAPQPWLCFRSALRIKIQNQKEINSSPSGQEWLGLSVTFASSLFRRLVTEPQSSFPNSHWWHSLISTRILVIAILLERRKNTNIHFEEYICYISYGTLVGVRWISRLNMWMTQQRSEWLLLLDLKSNYRRTWFNTRPIL